MSTPTDPRERWGQGALDGLLGGGVIWLAEAVAVAAVNADVGGLAVLMELRAPLAGWGLGYLAVGALLGLLRPTRLGALGPVFGWSVLLLLAARGVAPWGVQAGVVLGAVAVSEGLTRGLGESWRRAVAGLAVVGMGLLAVPLVFLGARSGTAEAGPNVVLVVVDTLRADRVGLLTGEEGLTPEIDRIGREGLRFLNARATSSWTLPSHASLFTGELPGQHGAHAGHPVLDEALPTLAEKLDERGYRTVGLSANAWVSAGTGLDRGFERFGFLGGDAISSQLLLPLVLSRPEDLGGAAITRRAIGEIADAAEAGEPLFLFLNYLEAHEPLGTLPPEVLAEHAPGLEPTVGREWVREMPLFWCVCEEDRSDLACEDGLYRAGPQRVDQATTLYDAGVTYADQQIGRIRQALEEAGQLEDTILVVTSDHGEHLGEDGRMGHMVWLTEELVDIPLFVRAPGRVARGGGEARPIDLAGFHHWLLALVDGEEPVVPSRAATAEIHPHPGSLRDRWAMIYGCDFAPAGIGRELRLNPDGTLFRGRGAREEPVQVEELSPATRAALEALGYLQ